MRTSPATELKDIGIAIGPRSSAFGFGFGVGLGLGVRLGDRCRLLARGASVLLACPNAKEPRRRRYTPRLEVLDVAILAIETLRPTVATIRRHDRDLGEQPRRALSSVALDLQLASCARPTKRSIGTGWRGVNGLKSVILLAS
jgi:hypothetical protein